MSDRIAVMNRGVIEQLDAPEEVYERPRTEFVAGFIGVSNLMPGQVESVNGDAGRAAPRQRPDGAHAGRRRAARRPVPRRRAPGEAEVATVEEPAPAGQPSVEGLVEAAVYLGTATQMIVKLAGDVRLTVLVPNADEAERQRLPGAGARVRLAWAPEHMHVVSANGAAVAGAAAEIRNATETAGAVGLDQRSREEMQ